MHRFQKCRYQSTQYMQWWQPGIAKIVPGSHQFKIGFTNHPEFGQCYIDFILDINGEKISPPFHFELASIKFDDMHVAIELKEYV